jgi:hypothetical protein
MDLLGAERQQAIASSGSDTVRTGVEVPPWASRLVVHVSMSREQWARFTDFGLTLADSAGGQIATAPLNYAFGRIESSFDPGHAPARVAVELYPALAEPESREGWQAALSIRLYAAEEVPLSSAHGPGSAPRDEEKTLFTIPPSPWALSGGFVPLALLKVTDRGQVWTREVPLPEPAGSSSR